MKLYNRLYSEDIAKDLYLRACNYWQAYLQWKDIDIPSLSSEYYHKCEAIVALLESITVFNIGLGYNGKLSILKQRLDSFDFLKD